MQKNKIKIGFLPVTLKMFWELYPKLESKTETAYATVKAELEKSFEVYATELVGDIDEAVEAGKSLSIQQPDILVIWGNGYVCSNIPDAAIQQLSGIPILLLCTQLDSNVPSGMDYTRYWENSAYTAMVELGGTLSKQGITFESIVGLHDEPSVYDKLQKYAAVMATKQNLRKLNIGVVGYPYPGMLDIIVENGDVHQLGAKITQISLPELQDRMKSVKNSHVETFLESTKNSYDASCVNPSDLFLAAKLYCVLETLVKEYGIHAFCMHDYECLSTATGTLSEFALSMAENLLGISAGCEGDIPNTISAFVLRSLSGNSCMFADWSMFDDSRNAVLFVHNGKADPAIVVTPTLKPTAEPFGIIGEGVIFEVSGKPGPVTMASLIHDKDGWKIFASEGEALPAKAEPCRQNQITVQVDRPVREYMETVCNLGITHHINIVHGHIADRVKQLAGLLKISFVEP